ncbi:MAG TPA: hypothetical protein VKD71_03455 [Gemmataceae bacterium]|nr:hypothetical protein [Gemmataceae bacterium]
MSRLLLVAPFVIVLATVIPARAEKVPLSPEELRSTATHVVVGKVTAVYTRTETSGDWKYTHYIAEVRIAETEKGEGLKNGDVVYARYWQRQWVSKEKQPPSTIGHRGLPGQGETIRVYMARNAYDGFGNTNDGGFNVIGANGFEEVKPARK